MPANISTYTVINYFLLNTNGLQRSIEYSKATNTASMPAEHNNLHSSHAEKVSKHYVQRRKENA